ncbi:MAG: fumarylacetoacetate hydrolase family protein [SAR202 cluster bacterium]|nr:fumarylacetoacetate hydrolase family protein [SAR202 cluster bacterium]|tara:strand:- start:720 stop:1688 length:969 start_codon:yes stop_codon:yes gene_type:complete
MKIGFYNNFLPCIVKEGGVIDISDIVSNMKVSSPQFMLEKMIIDFNSIRSDIESSETNGKVIPFSEQIRLRPPVPRPGKVIAGQVNYKEGVTLNPPRPLRTFFKSPEAIIGPGDTIVLPSHRPVIFNHEAELAFVVGKTAKNIMERDALNYIFGYTTSVDVSARAPEEGEAQLPGTADAHYGKSFDTFLPIGPAITIADDIHNPNSLRVRYSVNGELRQDYNTNDMEHSVAYLLAAVSHVMTLKPGDLVLCGTNHGNLGPLQDGDVAEISIENIGSSTNFVTDPLKRKWDPHNLRSPATNAANREKLRWEWHSGNWPFNPSS